MQNFFNTSTIKLRFHNMTEHGWYNDYVQARMEKYVTLHGPVSTWDLNRAKLFLRNVSKRGPVKAFIQALRVADIAVHRAERAFIDLHGKNVNEKLLKHELGIIYKDSMRRSLTGIGDHVRALLKKAAGGRLVGTLTGIGFAVGLAAKVYGSESLAEARQAAKESLVWPDLTEAVVEAWVAEPLGKWFGNLQDFESILNDQLAQLDGTPKLELDDETLNKIEDKIALLPNLKDRFNRAKPDSDNQKSIGLQIEAVLRDIKILDPDGQY